jgi:hypothetical protein
MPKPCQETCPVGLGMNSRLLAVATSGEVREGVRVFYAKVASHERGSSGEAQSRHDPIFSLKAEFIRAAVDIGLIFSVKLAWKC